MLAKACGKTYCVGLANAYGTQNGLTYFVTAEQCRKHLTQYYRKAQVPSAAEFSQTAALATATNLLMAG